MKDTWGLERYFSLEYLNEGRFVDYYHTYKLVMQPKVQTVLEIGPGNGLVTWLLRNAGIQVTTFDITERVKPDVIGDVRSLPFGDESFDAVICCEVLEHIEFNDFIPSLAQIYKVSKKHAVISMPHVIPCWSIIAQLPLIGGIWGSVMNPFVRPPDLSEHSEHYWSIGSKGCSDKNVNKAIREAGWEIQLSYRPGFNKDHRFFLLTKSEKFHHII